MRWTHASPLLASATTVLATINFNQFHPDLAKRQIQAHQFLDVQEPLEKRQTPPVKQPLFLTNSTTRESFSLTAQNSQLTPPRIRHQWHGHSRS